MSLATAPFIDDARARCVICRRWRFPAGLRFVEMGRSYAVCCVLCYVRITQPIKK